MSNGMIGIIGGSGLGQALINHIDSVRYEDVDTPFGKPSASVVIGEMAGREIAFLNRHGEDHNFCPTSVPYAANIFALKKVGVMEFESQGLHPP